MVSTTIKALFQIPVDVRLFFTVGSFFKLKTKQKFPLLKRLLLQGADVLIKLEFVKPCSFKIVRNELEDVYEQMVMLPTISNSKLSN